MKLKRIKYLDLNARQKEIYNFQKVSSLLADYGFNCIKLADDWGGADFLAHDIDGNSTLKVQLKSRLTIDKKYSGKDICISFPVKKDWYLIEHDVLVGFVEECTNWLQTKSWLIEGGYSSANPNNKLLAAIEHMKL